MTPHPESSPEPRAERTQSEVLQVRKVEIVSDRYQRDGVERWFLNDTNALDYIGQEFDLAEVGERLTVTMVCDEMTRAQLRELMPDDDE